MSAEDITGGFFDGGGGDAAASGTEAAASAGDAYANVGQAIIQGAQIAGAVITVAGAITGNARLMQIGSVVAIGATAASAFSGLSGAATAGGGQVGSAPTAELASSAQDASSANEAASLANTSPSAMEEAFGGGQSAPSFSPSAGYADAVSSADNGQLLQGGQSQAFSQPATAAPLTPPDYSLSPGAIGGSDGVALQGSTLGQSAGGLTNASNTLNGPPAAQQGLIGRAMGWINNRENAGVVKLGTGLIGGAMQGYQQERVLDEQRRARDESRQYIEDQRTRYNRSILDQNINAR